MRAARAGHDGRILRGNVGPLLRQTRELARVVVEVDAVLTPFLPAIDQTKRTPLQGMEGMRDPDGYGRLPGVSCS